MPAFWYTSKSYVSQPGEYSEIPLKRKLRIGGTAPRFNKHSDNNRASRKHDKPNSFNPPSKVSYVDAGTGHARMMTREEFYQLSGWYCDY